MTSIDLLEEVKRLKAIADVGILYAENDYDKERYHELREISYKILGHVSGHPIEALQSSFPAAADYPTAKVDVRGIILSPDKKVLMVRESVDNKWSLPGGWADIGYSPKETIIKECKEETGLDVNPNKLLAVFDKRLHAHPPEPFYVYKMVFYCDAVSYEGKKGFDVLDVQYFAIDELPELSEDRILKTQIVLLYNKIITGDFSTYSD